jgi:hypothetical protein
MSDFRSGMYGEGTTSGDAEHAVVLGKISGPKEGGKAYGSFLLRAPTRHAHALSPNARVWLGGLSVSEQRIWAR